MSVNKYDATTGTLTILASGSRIWTGTKAAYDAQKAAGTLPNNCIIVITDDETAMDTVPTEGSPVAVTSDGIYKAIKKIKRTGTFSLNSSNLIDFTLDFAGTGINFYDTSCILDLRVDLWSTSAFSGMLSSWGKYAAEFKLIYDSATTLRIIVDNSSIASSFNNHYYEVIVQV